MTFLNNQDDPGPHVGHGQGPAGASLSDLLTAVKNVAVAIANLGQIFLQTQGTTTTGAMGLTGPTLVKIGSGRVGVVSVTAATAAGAPGQIIDSNSLGGGGGVIFTIPEVVGVYPVNLPYNLGLVVIPGVGETVTVSYS